MKEIRSVKKSDLTLRNGWISCDPFCKSDAISIELNKIGLKIVEVVKEGQSDGVYWFKIEQMTEVEINLKIVSLLEISSKLRKAIEEFEQFVSLKGLTCQRRLGIDLDILSCYISICLDVASLKFENIKELINLVTNKHNELKEKYKVTFDVMLLTQP